MGLRGYAMQFIRKTYTTLVPMEQLLAVLRDVLQALNYLHSKGVSPSSKILGL